MVVLLNEANEDAKEHNRLSKRKSMVLKDFGQLNRYYLQSFMNQVGNNTY